MRTGYVLVGWSVVAGILRAWRTRRRRGSAGELRYRANGGQDPAAALAALRQHGLTARIGFHHGFEDVVIECDPAEDRERVRAVLRQAPLDMAGHTMDGGPPIVFADEQPSA